MNRLWSFRLRSTAIVRKALWGCFVAVFALLLPGISSAEHTYTPLYDKGYPVFYYQDQKYQGDLISETRYGFTGFFDPYDPVLICQVANPYNCVAPPKDAYRFTLLADRPFPGYTFFRMYVPPGNVDFSFIGFPAQSDQIGVAVRFGQPPTGDYSELGSYDTFNWVTYPSASPNEPYTYYEDKDVLIKNSGGNVTFNVTKSPPNGGGWLYVQVLTFNRSAYFRKFSHDFKVSMDTYVNWYDTAEFVDNNPTGGIDLGLSLSDLDENNNNKVDMEDAIIKLQADKPQQEEIDRILQILSGQ